MQIITTLLIIFVVSFMLKSMGKSAGEAQVEEIENKKVMKSGKPLAYLGGIGILLGSVFPITYFVGPANQQGPKALIMDFSIFVVFGFMGLYLIYYYKKTRVEFNEVTVRTTNFLGKSKEIRWKDIQEVTFSSGSSWLALKTNTEKVLIHTFMLSGFNKFKKELQKQLPETLYAKAFEDINKAHSRRGL